MVPGPLREQTIQSIKASYTQHRNKRHLNSKHNSKEPLQQTLIEQDLTPEFAVNMLIQVSTQSSVMSEVTQSDMEG
jgi:hypothetical protein